MTGPTREWVTFADPVKKKRRWQVDVTFLTSTWRCVFGDCCQGVLTERSPALSQGCCSYGAHFSRKKDRDNVVRAAEKLTDDEWQFAKIGRKRGIYASVSTTEWRTRLVGDACIFLNRPDFAAGPGCALHLHAINTGKHHSKFKPEVCWQLPLRRVDREEDDGTTTAVLTEFARDGWGEGGDDFAWWCTEAPEAFTGKEPVYRSLETELRKMLGDTLFEQVTTYLDGRERATPPPVRHPAEVPVAFSGTRHKR